MKLDKSAHIRRLPFLANFDDAAAFYQREKDPFYLAALMVQCWLGGLVLHAAAQYAGKKNPKERALQSGEAWRSFSEMFGANPDSGQSYLLACLFQFSASDDSPGNSLR